MNEKKLFVICCTKYINRFTTTVGLASPSNSVCVSMVHVGEY